MSACNYNNIEDDKALSLEKIRSIPEFENFSDDQIRDIEASIKELSLLLYQIASQDNFSH